MIGAVMAVSLAVHGTAIAAQPEAADQTAAPSSDKSRAPAASHPADATASARSNTRDGAERGGQRARSPAQLADAVESELTHDALVSLNDVEV
ncbi:MAG: hypothetical protein SXG53_24700, partial [Pseudomonadota bacterium]|nr:hypothetical protein [Pseudomonadota bacterium]